MQIVLLAVVMYLFGSIPTGKILGLKLKGIDIQKHGSGNIGFANSCRVLGYKIGILVLIGDVSKSLLPLFILQNYFGITQRELMILGLMPIIGHAFPVWLNFKGGKSIATGLGVIFVLSPYLALFGIAIYCLAFCLSRKSAIGSLLAIWSLVIAANFIDDSMVFYSLLLAIFATFTHRNNIKQLVNK